MDWLNEKDYYVFNIMGYKCEIKRSQGTGALCGYITVSPNHVLLKESLRDNAIVEVHGGVTYQNGNKIGFDCGHYDDYCPLFRFNSPDAVYRNVDYVHEQLEGMAYQFYAEETLWNKFKIKIAILKDKIKTYIEGRML